MGKTAKKQNHRFALSRLLEEHRIILQLSVCETNIKIL